jgi:indolepyruvate decarboxylase
MTESVIEYTLRRLREIGIDAIFGVPGDFAFSVQDAIVKDPAIEWIGCCNELNAGNAADGYARVRGVGAVSTTYGVGELSAINAIAGSYAENLPVFHLTGMPAMPVQASHRLVHHTLGNGEFDLFRTMADTVLAASAIMTPQNVAYETERLIVTALVQSRPVYMAFPSDLANQPVVGHAEPIGAPGSDPSSLDAAVTGIIDELNAAQTACVLPGLLAVRLGLRDELQRFVDASGLPFATMFADKSVLDERQPGYIGMYDGKLMDEQVRVFVESCDRVVRVGAMMTDFNSGAFTASLDPQRLIDIGLHHCAIGSRVYPNVEMGDLLRELALRTTEFSSAVTPPCPPAPAEIIGQGDDAITAEGLYPRWEQFFRPDDVIVVETGTSSMGLAFAQLPRGATFHNQTLWGSIGWATPAAFGAAVADPDRRVVLVTGDGSHQLTAQEIGQFGRRGLKPIIFLLNNNGYLIERLLCADPDIAYNDVAPWNYAHLPHALGCTDWFTARVATCGELDLAISAASKATTGAYIEIVTDTYAASTLATKLHESRQTLYGASGPVAQPPSAASVSARAPLTSTQMLPVSASTREMHCSSPSFQKYMSPVIEPG